jgi:hypothetical protein
LPISRGIWQVQASEENITPSYAKSEAEIVIFLLQSFSPAAISFTIGATTTLPQPPLLSS